MSMDLFQLNIQNCCKLFEIFGAGRANKYSREIFPFAEWNCWRFSVDNVKKGFRAIKLKNDFLRISSP
jgi:hypothetical protein